MLTADDPLPHPPRRVVVAGVSGSGKTTTARRIGAVLGLPVTEMDAMHHGPSWTPRAEFLADVKAFSSADAWVCEWQYPAARELLADRADTMVWLDPPTALTMARIVRRTVVRRIRREELWNGNREDPLHTFFTDREHVVRWAWRTRNWMRENAAGIERGYPHLAIVRLRSRPDVERFVTRLSAGVA